MGVKKMILITGTNLKAEELPDYEILDPLVVAPKVMNMKLKTQANSPSCFQVYIAEALRTDFTVTDDLLKKIVYFNDDDDLIQAIKEGRSSKEGDIFDEPEPPKVEVPEFAPPKPVVYLDKKDEPAESIEQVNSNDGVENKVEVVGSNENISTQSNSNVDAFQGIKLDEVDTDLPAEFLQIPNIDDDTDSLKEQLKQKDRQLAQKDAQLKDMVKRFDDLCETQELQIEEIDKMWTKKLAEAQKQIDSFKDKVENYQFDEATLRFLKLINYGISSKAGVKEGFTEDELKVIGKLNSTYTVCACGSGDSCHGMLKQVRHYMDKHSESIVVDFTNDSYLASMFNIAVKGSHTMALFKDDVNPITLLKEVGPCKAKIIPSTNYNDIALISVDWSKILRKIDEMACGKHVILLFGNINNFNVRYTVSKLASLLPLYIFVKSSPIILKVLYSDMQFIPKERMNLIALEYIESVQSILQAFSNMVNVTAVTNEVNWSKLGVPN